MRTIVIVSGYFNPLHKGHIEMIEKAKELGEVAVIINNDKQQELKKGKIITDEQERMNIIEALKDVDYVFLSIDEDESVSKSLGEIVKLFIKSELLLGGKDKFNFIFANGGDRKSKEDIPEASICRRNNIEMIFGLGDKIQSSSNINKELGKE